MRLVVEGEIRAVDARTGAVGIGDPDDCCSQTVDVRIDQDVFLSHSFVG